MVSSSEAPPFWWERPDWRAWGLSPVSALYGLVAGARLASAPRKKVPAPVLCVGNFTVGGEGKTPVSIALAQEARRQGRRPGFLTRGHGGRLSHQHLVDVTEDTARLVGDEPLLLARHGLVVVTPDRVAGANRLLAEGCDFIIMDDGFQSARIFFDYALIVVDGRRGVGNGHVIPGGPLRARLLDQLRYCDGLVTMGEGAAGEAVVRRAARAGRAVFSAQLEPRRTDFSGKRVLAFAGIGNPDKFYGTLRAVGADVAVTRSFPDHYPFSQNDAADLLAQAAAQELMLVTTEKDMMRLRHSKGRLQELGATAQVLPVEAVFENKLVPSRIIGETLTAWRERSMAG